jgi:hypothetical protein
MNHPRLLPFVALFTLLSFDVTVGAAPNESALIRQRIDELLKRRQKPEPLPVDPPSPFALSSAVSGGSTMVREPAPGAGVSTAGAAVEKPEAEAGSATTTELLARVASRLHITGVISLKNQLNIIINDNPWKEGDFLIVNQGARIIRLQVMRIQPGQLTLRLEDAELVLKF